MGATRKGRAFFVWGGVFSDALFSVPVALMGFRKRRIPPCRRAYFLLLRQKKVAKEKATPGYAVGCADSPALLEAPGGCGTRGCAPQTVLADCPRPFSVARRFTLGPEKRLGTTALPKIGLLRSTPKKGQKPNPDFASAPTVFPGPLGGAEQRRAVGGRRLALSEPRSGEFSQPPNDPSSAGNPRSGHRLRVAFSLLTFFWRSKRKYARASGAENSAQSTQIARPQGTKKSFRKQTNQYRSLLQQSPNLGHIKSRQPTTR